MSVGELLARLTRVLDDARIPGVGDELRPARSGEPIAQDDRRPRRT